MASETPQPVVKAVGLTKEFRDFWYRLKASAVSDIDFEINEGEVVGLLGPNGSGKSTTVKMLLGLLYPTVGELSVFGRSPRDVATKKHIGYLPEETYLYKYLTAFETLDFIGTLFDLPAAERKKRANQLLDMVGLSHAKSRHVGEFSKGMQRRIGLAQAMINDPSLLILDEPTSGLDPLGIKEVKELIKLLKKRGKTIIVTSHLLSDIEDVCDRVIILYGGKIRAEGTLDKLLEIPEETQITTPMMSPELTQKVLAILRESLEGEEFKLTHPRKRLEAYFLEIIEQAKEDTVETSGVSGSGEIADYLTKDSSGESVLEALTKEEDVIEPSQTPVVEESSTIDNHALDSLVDDAPKREEDKEETVDAESRKELDAADEKLKSLLGD